MYGLLLVFLSNFSPKGHRFLDIRLQKCHDLENWVRGPSRSLEISSFDRAHTTIDVLYSNYMALSSVVSEVNFKKCRDLEIGVKGHSRSLKWCHSIDCVWFPISVL